MKRLSAFFAATLLATSAQANLIIDKNGVDEKDYVYDMHQCEELAAQVQKDNRSRGAVGSAAKGAAVGAAGTAIAGGSGSDGAKVGAGVGLAAGVIGGRRDRIANQANYEAEQQEVMRNCMTNRGYTVLN
jgi:hypothetical protein